MLCLHLSIHTDNNDNDNNNHPMVYNSIYTQPKKNLERWKDYGSIQDWSLYVCTSDVEKDRYTSFETISGITKIHSLEVERWIRFLNKQWRSISLIFQSTFPHQTGHISSNKKKVGQGEQFRKTRGTMRREGNQKQLWARLQITAQREEVVESRKERRLSWELQRAVRIACSSQQWFKECGKRKKPECWAHVCHEHLAARWRTTIRF